MYVTAYFSSSGSPATGLTPTVDIYKVSDSSQVASSAAMTEIGGGWYKYNFSTADDVEAYVTVCDGGATLSASERYAPGYNVNTLGDVVENSLNLREAIAILLAEASGKVTGGGTTVIRYKSQDGSTTRITKVVDQVGNRSTITIDTTDL